MTEFAPPGGLGYDVSRFNTCFTVACSPPTKKDSDGLPVNPKGVIYANSSKTLRFVNNPVQTDVTEALQCDIKQLLKANPDVNGLALMLDDNIEDRSQYLSVEDFLPPSQYRDVFDIIEFTRQAEQSFYRLPASLRKQFHNDPMLLCAALEQNDSAVLSALNEYIYGPSGQQNSATASRQGASSDNEASEKTDKTPPTSSSDEVNKT